MSAIAVFRQPFLALAAVALLALAPAARAQHVTELLPAETAAVIRVASVDRVIGGWNDMLGAMGPLASTGKPYTEQAVGEVFDVRNSLGKIDRQAAAFLVLLLPDAVREDPSMRLVQAKDEAALRRAVVNAGDGDAPTVEAGPAGFEKVSHNGRTAYFGKVGGWIAYTRSEAAANKFGQLAAGPKLSSVIDERSKQLFDAGEVAAFVNVAALTARFQAELKQGREEVRRGIEGVVQQIPPNAGDPATVKQALTQAATLAFDAVDDAKALAWSASFSSAGFGGAALATVKDGTGTDKLFAANPASLVETLGLLPAGASLYYGAHFGPDLVRSFMEANVAAAGQQGPKDPAAFKAALEQLAQAKPGPITGSFAFPTDSTSGMTAYSLTQAEDSQAVKVADRALIQAIGEVKTPAYSQSTEIKPDAETYKNKPVDLLSVKVSLPEGEDPGLQFGRILIKKLYGGDALYTRLIALEGVLAQAAGPDPTRLHRLVDGLESGEGVIGLQEAYSTTRDKLAEQTNLVVLIDVPRLVVDGFKMVRDEPPINMLPIPFNPGFQPEVSFAGVSVSTEPHGLRIQTFVPASQVAGVFAAFGF